MKSKNFSPNIELIRQDNSLLVFTNVYTRQDGIDGLFQSKLIKIQNFDEITETTLELDEGFDTLQGDENPFLKGNLYIVTKSKFDSKKTLIAEPYIPIVLTKVKNQSIAFQELRQVIIESFHNEFYRALNNIEAPRSQLITLHSTQSAPGKAFSFNDFVGGKSKYILYSFVGLIFCYMALGLYEKKISVDNQANSSLNLSMDAKQLTKTDDEAMDRMFKDIGIDRNALSSDLSCFSE